MWNGIFKVLVIFMVFISFVQSNDKTFKNYNFTLTFDDGPHPETTPILLEQLKEKNVKNAIFFLIGDRIAQYPELVKKIQSYQYDIGYHSMHHTNQAKMTAEEIHQDIQEFKKTLNKALESNYDLKYARPPFGGMTPKTVKIFKELKTTEKLKQQSLDDEFNAQLIAKQVRETYQANKLQTLLWNVDFKDWEQRIDVNHASEQFVQNLNQVWLFHEMPSYKGTIFNNQITEDLPKFLDFLCEHYC
jgi:peptidoglycan/xylan/chitin deacetylase (PgdA/CDA1 family)